MKHHMTPRIPPIHRRPLTTNPLNDTHSTSLLVDKLQITSVRSCLAGDSGAKEETVSTETNGKRVVSPQHRGGTSVGGDGEETLQTDRKLQSGDAPGSVEVRSAQDEVCAAEGGDRKHHHQHTYSGDSTELLEDDQIPVAQTVESTMVELTPEDMLHHSRSTSTKSPQKMENELKRVVVDEERDTGTSSHDEEQEIVANSTAQSESDNEQDQEYGNLFKKIAEATKTAPKSLTSRGRGRKRRSKSRKK